MLIEDKDQARFTRNVHSVSTIRHLTDSTFVLRFTRGDLQFRAGQHLIIGLEGELDQREYSVYSGENDDFLEILVREVKDGNISAKLNQSKPGQLLNVNGPFGTFGADQLIRNSGNLVFIATGTGIAPFHSIVRSYPGLKYTLIHGVSYSEEAYEYGDYDSDSYILCTSKERSNGRQGRVTSFIHDFRVKPGMHFYLCGNSSMIYEAYHILLNKGIPGENIFSERYF